MEANQSANSKLHLSVDFIFLATRDVSGIVSHREDVQRTFRGRDGLSITWPSLSSGMAASYFASI